MRESDPSHREYDVVDEGRKCGSVPEQYPHAPHTLFVLIGRIRSPVPACQPLLQALG